MHVITFVDCTQHSQGSGMAARVGGQDLRRTFPYCRNYELGADDVVNHGQSVRGPPRQNAADLSVDDYSMAESADCLEAAG